MSNELSSFVLRAAIRLLVRPLMSPAVPIRWQRLFLNASANKRISGDVAVSVEQLGAVLAEQLRVAPTRIDAAILYLHGGGYCIGSATSHRPLTARLAQLSHLPIWVPDYRLAPEHPYPAALEDAVHAYNALRDRGIRHIILAGDSAGGGLALATALTLRAAGGPAPAALLLLSPWTDLGLSGESIRTQADKDPMLSPKILRRWALAYLAKTPADEPLCSPLRAELADLAQLPATLIQCGSDEVLLDDSRRLQQRLSAAGSAAELHIYPGLWHVFQLHAGALAKADAALQQASDFIGSQLPNHAQA